MRSVVVVFAAAVMLLVGALAWAEPKDGEQLERQIWANFKAQDWAAVEAMIAPGFQSSHQDGARGRSAEIELLKGLNLGDYTLSDFRVTGNGPVMVVTYTVTASHEEIEGRSIPTTPAQRLSVWLKTEAGWQWIAHVNLAPLRD
ncbi:MAG: nuclear transport factor 2 family protein [Deltaproteobacteria bacterium]|nr:nuclear transport factor 2 family protein [Deltaproteobacteria bacterium]